MTLQAGSPPLTSAEETGYSNAIQTMFHKYADFNGRASRREFWLAFAFIALVQSVPICIIAVGVLASYASMPGLGTTSFNFTATPWSPTDGVVALEHLLHTPASGIIVAGVLVHLAISLIICIPALALTWRRLHDVNLPGAVALIAVLPVIGALCVLLFALFPSHIGGERFDDKVYVPWPKV